MANGRRRKPPATEKRKKAPTHKRNAAHPRVDKLEAPYCAVFGRCGGCDFLDTPYVEQLAQKQAAIEALFVDATARGVVRPIIGMSKPFQYRNKVLAPLIKKRGHQQGAHGDTSSFICSGMYAKGTHEVIEAPEGCILEHPYAKQVVDAVKAIMVRHRIEPYDEDRGSGFLRHVQIRVGHNSDEVLVTLVTNTDEFPHAKSFCRELVDKAPCITSIVQNINRRQTNVVLGDKERTLYGPGFILDELCGATFRLSSRSFYQVNAVQTEVLYTVAMKLAGLGDTAIEQDASGLTVLDAYCGTGTIGVIAAKAGAQYVVGVDSVESAIRDARQNARHNGIESAVFHCEDAGRFMRQGRSGAFDVLFVDPPRAGASQEFLDAAIQAAPAKIVYISCNPQTQVRDVAVLEKHGYHIETVQPVDMFPHTAHIENVVSLVRNDVAMMVTGDCGGEMCAGIVSQDNETKGGQVDDAQVHDKPE